MFALQESEIKLKDKKNNQVHFKEGNFFKKLNAITLKVIICEIK